MWLTCGGLGSTTLPELEKSLISFGVFLMVMTHRVSPFRPDGPEPPLRCRRFAHGYALDGSECPSYLVWPQRDGQSYVLLDTSTTDTLPLNHEFFRPLGMEHFYDSFALESQISVGKLCTCLACEKMNYCLTCILPEMGCCVSGLVPIKNIDVARATDRTKVSADVIQLVSPQLDLRP